MTAGVDHTAVEARAAEHLARGADRLEFSMGGRVLRRVNLVDARSDDGAVLDEDRSEGAAAPAHVLARQINGFTEEALG